MTVVGTEACTSGCCLGEGDTTGAGELFGSTTPPSPKPAIGDVCNAGAGVAGDCTVVDGIMGVFGALPKTADAVEVS